MSEPAPIPRAEAARAAPLRARRLVFAAGALAYAGVIFWLSSQPNPLPFLPRSIFSHDKLLHMLEYAVLGGLLRAALAGFGLPGRRGLLLALALGSLYGATDEWHQAFVPNRECDVFDWLADSTGAVVGAALASAFLRRRGGAG
jgi:VanZ family protein